MEQLPIRCRGLRRSFGAVTALAGVDLEVGAGEIVALLGPNGVGKSTLLRILCTTLLTDGGSAEICGADAAADPVAARSFRATATGLARDRHRRRSARGRPRCRRPRARLRRRRRHRRDAVAMSGLTILAAFVRRDLAIDLSYRAAFVLRAVSLLLTLALFYYLGDVVDDAAFEDQQGISAGYFGYVAIGLATFTVIQTSLISFSRRLREEQTTGTFEALMTTPARPAPIILASAVYEVARATIDGLVILLAAVVIFGLRLDTSPQGIAIALLTMAAALALFASLGIVVAALTVLFKRTTALLALIISAIALLSGVYFPIDVLPAAVEAVAAAIPFTWTLELLRAALLGDDVDAARLAGLVASVVVLLPVALVCFTSALRRARRLGTLALY